MFILFYLSFCFGPRVSIENSSFGICGVVPSFSSVRKINVLHIDASYILNTLHTTFLFTPPAIHMRHCHEQRQTNVCCVLFQCTKLHYNFQYLFHTGELIMSAFPYSVKEGLTKHRYFFRCLKICKILFTKYKILSLGALFHHSRCPKAVQIPSFRMGNQISYPHASQTAD